MSTSLEFIEDGANALAETSLNKAIRLRRARREVMQLCTLCKRVEAHLIKRVDEGDIGAGELLLELRDALHTVGGST